MIKTLFLLGLVLTIITACDSNHSTPSLSLHDWQALAQNIELHYTVLDNTQDGANSFTSQLSFTNHSQRALPETGWQLYFNHIHPIRTVDNPHVTIQHINGDLWVLTPTDSFPSLPPGNTLTVAFTAGNWQVAKTDIMPNWYLSFDHNNQTATALITSTSNHLSGQVPTPPSKELPFVTDFDTPQQWKRYDSPAFFDHYNPFTAQDRYQRNQDLTVLTAVQGVVPTPASLTIDNDSVWINNDWSIIIDDDAYQPTADLLADQWGLGVIHSTPATHRIIRIDQGPVEIDGLAKTSEAYQLTIDPLNEYIRITATDPAGAFYAAQSLLQLDREGYLPAVTITDAPRFAYRGLSIDVARNFHDKTTIMQLLDQMATFKLNTLHLHLTDDEGWRIEIAALPELTEVGAKRCHDLSERTCLLPFLGAGSDGTHASNGYYSADDYRDILSHANRLHITIIPEIDMPGHAHAAIKAMEARYYNHLHAGDNIGAHQYLLTDFDDTTDYFSIQMFTDNAINVCMESTYHFVDAVVSELVALHQDIQPLTTFHFGGDEVAGAWTQSPACQALLANNTDGIASIADLPGYFLQRVSAITTSYGLNLGAWEDGLIKGTQVYPRSELINPQVIGNAWDNVWEWGVADRAYNLANNDYGVIYNQATHLYFDHPYEPDPEERGYYWAPRFTDTRKVFGFMPGNIFANADFTRAGAPITEQEVWDSAGVKYLEQPENVLGMQASLWSETIRSTHQLHGMLFPRLIAMAERTWHAAFWEADTELNRSEDPTQRLTDYNHFANLLGQQILPQLEQAGIAFRLPVPGAIIEHGTLKVNSPLPGLAIEYSLNHGKTWQRYHEHTPPQVWEGTSIQIRTVSGERTSRVTEITW